MKIKLLGSGHVDIQSYDPVSPRAVTVAASRTFDFVNGESDRTRMEGRDLRYGSGEANGPTAGRIETVRLFSGAADPLARVTGTLRVDGLPDDAFTSGEAFWGEVLDGRSNLDLRRGPENDVFLARTVMAGDGVAHRGGSGEGANDRARLGDAEVTFYGDVEMLGIEGGSYQGGDDLVRGGSNPDADAVVSGDVGRIFQGNAFRGGDDRIEVEGGATVYGDAYRMLFGGSSLRGGDDVIEIGGMTGEGARMSYAYGDIDEVSETNLGASQVRAGDDVLRGGEGPVTLVGDVRYLDADREGSVQKMGDDEIRGGDGNDILIGDVDFFGSQAVIELGDDDIRGGDGDDMIYGDVREIYGFTSSAYFRGGDDRIRDGRGDDVVRAGVGDDVVIAGGGDDDYDGGAGYDRLVYKSSAGGVRVDMREGTGHGGKASGDFVTGFERIDGSRRGDDRLSGDDEANRLRGFGGDDRLWGRGGKDRLEGGSGDDDLRGHGGRDRLEGGRGDDDLHGGSGSDAFVFSRGDDRDVIEDLKKSDAILLEDFGQDAVEDALDDARSRNGDVVIDFGDGDRLTIEDVSLSRALAAIEIL